MPSAAKPAAIGPIDRGMARALGVAALFLCNEYGAVRDLITGKTIVVPGGFGTSTEGSTLTFSGSQQGGMSFTFPAGNSTAASGGVSLTSIYCGRILATAAQAGTPGAAFGGDVSTVDQSGIGIGFDPSNNVGGWNLDANGSFMQAYNAGALNTWYTVYTQADTTNLKQYAWINGQPAVTGQGSAYTGAFTNPFDEFYFGSEHRSSGVLRNFTGNLEWAALLDLGGQKMTDAQASALYAMDFPYCLLNNRKKRWLWVASAATGLGPRLSDRANVLIGGGLVLA